MMLFKAGLGAIDGATTGGNFDCLFHLTSTVTGHG